jgi:hypothetical protein
MSEEPKDPRWTRDGLRCVLGVPIPGGRVEVYFNGKEWGNEQRIWLGKFLAVGMYTEVVPAIEAQCAEPEVPLV